MLEIVQCIYPKINKLNMILRSDPSPYIRIFRIVYGLFLLIVTIYLNSHNGSGFLPIGWVFKTRWMVFCWSEKSASTITILYMCLICWRWVFIMLNLMALNTIQTCIKVTVSLFVWKVLLINGTSEMILYACTIKTLAFAKYKYLRKN